MKKLVQGTGPGARAGGFSRYHGYHRGNTFRHLSWNSSRPGKGKQEVIHRTTASRADSSHLLTCIQAELRVCSQTASRNPVVGETGLVIKLNSAQAELNKFRLFELPFHCLSHCSSLLCAPLLQKSKQTNFLLSF